MTYSSIENQISDLFSTFISMKKLDHLNLELRSVIKPGDLIIGYILSLPNVVTVGKFPYIVLLKSPSIKSSDMMAGYRKIAGLKHCTLDSAAVCMNAYLVVAGPDTNNGYEGHMFDMIVDDSQVKYYHSLPYDTVKQFIVKRV